MCCTVSKKQLVETLDFINYFSKGSEARIHKLFAGSHLLYAQYNKQRRKQEI